MPTVEDMQSSGTLTVLLRDKNLRHLNALCISLTIFNEFKLHEFVIKSHVHCLNTQNQPTLLNNANFHDSRQQNKLILIRSINDFFFLFCISA